MDIAKDPRPLAVQAAAILGVDPVGVQVTTEEGVIKVSLVKYTVEYIIDDTGGLTGEQVGTVTVVGDVPAGKQKEITAWAKAL